MPFQNRRQPGFLFVRLQEAARGVTTAAGPAGSAAQHPLSGPDKPLVESPEQDVDFDIVESIQYVVDKIHIMVDEVAETAKVRVALASIASVAHSELTLTSCYSSALTQTLHGKS